MMLSWPVQKAKAKFSAILERLRRKSRAPPSPKELLLADEPRFELPLPRRGRLQRREPPVFD